MEKNMVNWILIVLILVGIFAFFKMSPGARFGNTWTIAMAIIIIFIVATLGFVITRPGIDVTTYEGFVGAVRTYFAFLGSLFDSTATITGNVVNEFSQNVTEVSRR